MKLLKQINEINDLAEKHLQETTAASIPTANLSAEDVLVWLRKFWPIMRITLGFMKLFTNDSADRVIDQIITWGDTVLATAGTKK